MGSNCCKFISDNNEEQLNLNEEVLKERKLKQRFSFKQFGSGIYDTNKLINQKTSDILNRNNSLNSNNELSSIKTQLQNNLVLLINKLRQDPLFFIPIINKYSQMIQFNEKKKTLLY